MDDSGEDGEPYSVMRASELYPIKQARSDEDGLQVPFPLVTGEGVTFLGRTGYGVIALSNYRLFVRFHDSFINVPLGLIETVEQRELFYVYVVSKDTHSFKIGFLSNDPCQEWCARVQSAISPPKSLQDVFSFAFFAHCKDVLNDNLDNPESSPVLCTLVCEDSDKGYSFDSEVERLGLITKQNSTWRITHFNETFQICSSYPRLHIVPKAISDQTLMESADFRASKRFPSVVWRHRSGAVICRSSQPLTGLIWWRNLEDEKLILAIAEACIISPNESKSNSSGESDTVRDSDQNAEGDCNSSTAIQQQHLPPISKETHSASERVGEETSNPKKPLIIDARSYTAAMGNRAKGGGVECSEYYKNCEIQFMGLANIHAVRKSFQAIRLMCSTAGDQASWLQNIDNSKWLQYISNIIRAALIAVHTLDVEHRPVLVHCSDGWDRTPQIVALAQLMLDPHYRTFVGFRVLIEREWLDYGHKFADRSGNAICREDTNERSPIFLQFLDCVHQILLQYPCSFEFNHAYLIKLSLHTYSNLFGTFLCNNTRERLQNKVPDQTGSVWSYLSGNKSFINPLYERKSQLQVLQPSWYLKDLQLWKALYKSQIAPSAALVEPDESCQNDDLENDKDMQNNHLLHKTRSCENLTTSGDYSSLAPTGNRRLSDPNVKADPMLASSHSASGDAIPSNVNPPAEIAATSPEFSETSEAAGIIGEDARANTSIASNPEILAEDAVIGSDDEVQRNGSAASSCTLVGDKSPLSESKVSRSDEALQSNTNSDKEGNGESLNRKEEADCQRREVDTMEMQQTSDCDNIANLCSSSESLKKTPVTAIDHETCAKKDNGEGAIEEKHSHHLKEGKHECKNSSKDGENSSDDNQLSGASGAQTNGHASELEKNCQLTRSYGVHNMSSDNHLNKVSSSKPAHVVSEENAVGSHTVSLQSNIPSSLVDKKSGVEICQEKGSLHLENGVTGEVNQNKTQASNTSLSSCTSQSHVAAFKTTQLEKHCSSASAISHVNKEKTSDIVQNRNDNCITSCSSSEQFNVNNSQQETLHNILHSQSVNVSTSTGDLSDSSIVDSKISQDVKETHSSQICSAQQVHRDTSFNKRSHKHLHVDLGLAAGASSSTGFGSRESSHGSVQSEKGSQINSRATSSAADSPSPSSDRMYGDSHSRQVQRVTRCLDIDGLQTYEDPVWRKERQLIDDYENQITTLKHHIQELLTEQNSRNGSGEIAILCLDAEMDEEEKQSIGGQSTNSDRSYGFVKLDDQDEIVQLWFPDHAVTHCTGCGSEFGMLFRRRHHCRNCGKVFCDSCTPHFIPVPRQQLPNPVRVCHKCYNREMEYEPVPECITGNTEAELEGAMQDIDLIDE